MKRDYRIGMRYIKTALAVTLCILIAEGLHAEYPFFSAIAAIITMESTVAAGFIAGRNRILGTFVGAAIGLLFVILMPENPFLSGFGVMLIIYICHHMGWHQTISIATMVFLAIMLNLQGHDPVLYSINRIEDTLLGIIVALGVNVLVFPPDTARILIDNERRLNTDIRETVADRLCRGQQVDLDGMLAAIVALEGQRNQHDSEFRLKRAQDAEQVEAVKDKLVIYRNLYAHMKMLMRLGGEPCMDEQSVKRIQAFFAIPVPAGCRVDDDLNRVYNYHVSKILDDLEQIG